MPQDIVFATNNAHKLTELQQILGDDFNIIPLSGIGCHDDIPEDADTLEGNALAKAMWVSQRYGTDCIADDTGLEVDALGGQPGVHSARYAPGTGHDAQANTALLLKNLANIPMPQRTARFRTVIALVRKGHNPEFFQGIVQGRITTSPQGNAGFGYDPVFMPDGWDITFGQASAAQKNAVSHRARASLALAQFLKKIAPDNNL